MTARFLQSCFLVFICACSVSAGVSLPKFFGDNMVLQRDQKVAVWGRAKPQEAVQVTFGGQTKNTHADELGSWMVRLDPMPASNEERVLVVNESVRLENILVGDVWLCSGQSNMEWALRGALDAKQEVASANYPEIRHIKIERQTGDIPRADVRQVKGWDVCQPDKAGERPAVMPSMPVIGTGGRVPTSLYNEMIHPLTPFAIKGAIGYQGESNEADGMGYLPKMKALIKGWREVWNHQGDLPFYFVQLANFKNSPDAPAGGDGWAPLREAQRKALELDHTGMAVAIDIGETGDIHPKNKQAVGVRLARLALEDAYGKDIVPSGPLFDRITIHGGRIHVYFKYADSGLMVGRKEGLDPSQEVAGGQLKEFAVAGSDKVWHWAGAVIGGDKVVVSSKDVANPVAVRYAYRMNPLRANLYNKEGLPASPFRTDEW